MNIGTLTGSIEIEDQAVGVLDNVIDRVETLGDLFEDKFGAIGKSVAIATTAVVAFTGAVTALAVKGSDVNDVTSTFERFSESAGGAEEVLTRLQRGVKGTVDDLTLMKDANRALAANVKLTAQDFGTLAEAAFVLQNRGLGTTEEMLNMVTQAMVTGRTRTLAMTIGVVDAEDATRKYADSLGLAVSQLTATQQAEGRRITVMKMLSDAVQSTGEQQLDFGEKIERIMASVANKFDELAARVASSTHVAAALDAIMKAFEGFGTADEIIETLIEWIDKFADAVTTYGPTVVNALISIKNWISSIWTAVTDAWDTVPDWFKEIAKAGIVAAGMIYLVDKATMTLAGAQAHAQASGEGMLGTMSDYSTITDASISVGKLAVELKGARGAIQGVAEHWRLMTPSMDGVMKSMPTLLGKFALWTTIATSAYEVGKTLHLMWVNHKEDAERAASAIQQQAVDVQNLTRLNQAMGTTYTDVNTASAAWIAEQKKVKPVLDENAEALARNTALLQAHEASVQAVVDSARKVAQDIDVQRDAFKRLGDQILFNKESQDMFTTAMDKMIESGRSLTDAESKRYDIIVRGRLANVEYGTALLRSNKVTVEAIEVGRALGLTEQELAKSFGTTTGALKAYETEMRSLKDVKQEVADLELQVGGRNAEVTINQREREYEASLRSFRGTSVAYDEFARELRRKKDAETALDHQSSAQSISDKQAEADGALREFNRMAISGNYHRADLEKQRELYYKLRDAASAMGDAQVAAQTKSADATKLQNAELQRQNELMKLQVVQTMQGRVQQRYEQVDERNIGEIQKQILDLTKAIASFHVPELKDRKFFDETTYYAALADERKAVQAQENRKAQLAYLQTLIEGYESPSTSTKSVYGALPGKATSGPTPTGRPNSSGGGMSVSFGPNSVVLNYPLMNDVNAKNEIVEMLGEAFTSSMREKGLTLG